jgi:hypothetical protein
MTLNWRNALGVLLSEEVAHAELELELNLIHAERHELVVLLVGQIQKL